MSGEKEVWEMIKLRPDITFWLQTKRAERVLDNLPSWWGRWIRKCNNGIYNRKSKKEQMRDYQFY